jgi:hypothetical protein
MRVSLRASRRQFLERAATVSAAVLAAPLLSGSAQRRATVLVNHIGFLPRGSKVCLVAQDDSKAGAFQVVHAGTGAIAFRGDPRSAGTDLGAFRIGDFSRLETIGDYYIQAGDYRSVVFPISPDVYLDPVSKAIGYFAIQRCGDSTTGYHAPCHLDDGRRKDNGLHQRAVGGWHDACDVRKWVDATIYGMLGLADVAGLYPKSPQRGAIIQELRWGNSYFHAMQEPAGYVMDYCGGDDGNNFTDNAIGSSDDRVVHTNPCQIVAQFHFIAAQAQVARLLIDSDPVYAKRCEAAAARTLRWCIAKSLPRGASGLAAAMSACAAGYRAFGTSDYRDLAVDCTRQLLALQVKRGAANSPFGFFLTSPHDREPVREIMNGNLPLLALCDVLDVFPGHSASGSWRDALALHTEYLAAMSQRSAFGIIPFGLYSQDPGGNRRIGNYWYRWFMMRGHENRSTSDWWVGTNAHLASNGLGLVRAAYILKNPQLAALAQRQLDWILGNNPLNCSMMTGVGINQPELYRNRALTPHTPLIPGGVMNGLGGSAADECIVEPGEWTTCEYWTPMVSYTMRLAAALQSGGQH